MTNKEFADLINIQPTPLNGSSPLDDCSRIICTMDGDGRIFVKGNVFHEDAQELLKAVALYMAQSAKADPENLLRTALDDIKWDRRAERIRNFGKPKKAVGA